MDSVELSGAKSSLWWPCSRLRESLWESVRTILRESGYDRRWFIRKGGKVGLQGPGYSVAIPAIYDDILITYDGNERMEYPIPIMLDGRCALVRPDGDGTPVTGFNYDLLFREPWTEYVKYIAVRNGKTGVLDSAGRELVPCEMDAVYGRLDPDGVIPLLKDGKWGLLAFESQFIKPVFDELDIRSESFVKARIGNQWGWIDLQGNLTQDRASAAIGSWYDDDK